MAAYTTRIVLHGGIESDYEKLHAEMKSRGFARVIQGSTKKWYHLPPAEYRYDGAKDIKAVHALAEAAISAIGKTGAIFITGGEGCYWSGLDEAEPPDS